MLRESRPPSDHFTLLVNNHQIKTTHAASPPKFQKLICNGFQHHKLKLTIPITIKIMEILQDTLKGRS
jgi:hypothetical protein